MIPYKLRPEDELADWEIQLLEDLKQASRRLYDTPLLKWSNGYWTREFKKVFGEIADRHNYECRMHSHGGEFLWDISWIEPKTPSIKDRFRVALSCEIEWNRGDEALIDFRKLTVSRAPHLIMIFDQEWTKKGGNRFNAKLDEMLKIIPEGTGQKYLFIGIKSAVQQKDNSTELVEYRAYTSL